MQRYAASDTWWCWLSVASSEKISANSIEPTHRAESKNYIARPLHMLGVDFDHTVPLNNCMTGVQPYLNFLFL